MNLDKIREQLDMLDEKLAIILSKRMSLIPKVAEYKKIRKIKRKDPKREKQIIEKQRKLAEKLNINPDLLEDLFKRIIKESHKIEKNIMKK